MPRTPTSFGPLVLGATGRVGQLWRAMAANGHWPGSAQPLFHARNAGRAAPGDYVWDMTGPATTDPRLAHVTGMIVLAGATSGDDKALASNTNAALAALDLAAQIGIAPVLLASSVAVYGRPAPDAPALAEDAPRAATAAYGIAKGDMERAVAAHAHPSTCLRIANVAGADALFGHAALGPMTLDQFADGTSPRRHMIGPVTLARTALLLIEAHQIGAALPRVVNVASPGAFAMSDLLAAAGVAFNWQAAGENALVALPLNLRLLASLIPLDETNATALVAEARAAGWVANP